MKIIECPRDAMQGIHEFIPTDLKAEYINSLLKVGFDTIDFGSFVSPKAIPQMRDTAEVLQKLDLSQSKSKLLAIVANTRGAQDAAQYEEITYLGFPLSISETFQQRNTNRSVEEAMQVLQEIQDICEKRNKVLVTYISMGFGNPYGDPYNVDVVEEFVDRLKAMQVKVISLADTIGTATEQDIQSLFRKIAGKYTQVEVGVHLHSLKEDAYAKVKAAYEAGCQRFDGALLGYGGCPMAKDDLTGNIPTEEIIRCLKNQGAKLSLNQEVLQTSIEIAKRVFL